MGQMECYQNDKVCIKSATKLMEQLNVCEKNFQVAWVAKIRNMQSFGNDKAGMHLAVETTEDSIFVYGIEPADNLLKSISTGLTGHDAVAALDEDNKICLFSVKGDRLYYVKELAPSSGTFSKMAELSITRPKCDCRIDGLQIYPLTGDKNSPFLLVVILKSEKGYWLDLHYWNVSTDVLFPIPVTTRCFTFSGDARENLKLRVAKNNYGVYDVTTAKVECSIPIKWKDNRPSGISITYISDQVFLLSNDNDRMKISVLEENSEKNGYTLSELFQADAIHCFQAWENGDEIEFAVHTDMLCHGTVTVSNGICKAGSLNPLAADAFALSTMMYKNSAQLFYITGEEQLLHRLEDMEGESWNETTYEKPIPGSVTRMSCYSTELTITDPNHKSVPLTDTRVVLHAEFRTYVEIPDGIFMIDEENSVTMQTDHEGKTFFRQYTNSLDVPTIYAELEENLLGDDNELSFSQFSDIYDTIGKVDTDTLLNAVQTDSKKNATTPLIPDEYRTKENAEQLASGLKQLISSYSQEGSGVMCLQRKSERKNKLFKQNADLPSWRIEFTDDGRVIYEELTPQEAEERIRNFSGADNVTLPKWLTKIGDFFRSVAQSIVKVCEVVINGVKAAVKFVLNGIEMVFETVFEIVQDVLKFVEIIFAPVLVLFKQLFRWLASLLGWDYVLYTKRAIVGLIETFIDWLPQNSEKISDFICGTISEADQKLDAWIDEAIGQIIPDQGLMDYVEKNTPAENEQVAYETSNNPLMAKLNQSYKYDMLQYDLLEAVQDNGSIEELYKILKAFIAKISDSSSFQEAKDYFTEAFKNMDHFFSFLLAGLLSAIRGLIHAVLSGCSELIKTAFDLVSELMAELKKVITQKIEIPLISEIYSWLSDEELSILDMAGLFAAFPATIMSKLFLGSVMFSSKEEADAFVSRVSKCLIFDGTETMSGKEGLTDLPKEDQLEVMIVLTSCAGLYGIFNTMLDFDTSKSYMSKTINTIISWVSLLFEVGWLVTSVPTFSEYEKLDLEERIYAWTAWVVFSIGLLGDLICTIRTMKHVDAEEDGRRFTTTYGGIHLIVAIVGIGRHMIDYTSFFGELAGSVIEMSRLCIIEGSTGLSNRVAIAIDMVGAAVILTCNILDITGATDHEGNNDQNALILKEELLWQNS